MMVWTIGAATAGGATFATWIWRRTMWRRVTPATTPTLAHPTTATAALSRNTCSSTAVITRYSIRRTPRGGTSVRHHGGHLYLIREREFLKTRELVFKIGKTTDVRHRMPAYPKDSLLYAMVHCPHALGDTEKRLLRHFDAHFVRRDDIGREYYETFDENQMLHCFLGFWIPKDDNRATGRATKTVPPT